MLLGGLPRVWRLAATWLSELRTVWQIVFSPIRGATHRDRLESFYQRQAAHYDAFRARLLHGREEMVRSAARAAGGGTWIDMGGGTAANLDFAGDEIVMSFARIYVVDLCPSLLAVARQRCAQRGWHHVVCVEADATQWRPPEGSADLVTFSYSLTMVPDWYVALDLARDLLSPGGTIGVTDFYVARKHATHPLATHSYAQRTLWPWWFAHDDVRLSADHLPYLQQAR